MQISSIVEDFKNNAGKMRFGKIVWLKQSLQILPLFPIH